MKKVVFFFSISIVILTSCSETKKSPAFASIVSILPGAGRAYAGRKLDGLMGLWTVYLTTSSAIYANNNKNRILGPLLIGFAGVEKSMLAPKFSVIWKADYVHGFLPAKL